MRFGLDFDGEAGMEIPMQDLADPVDQVLHVPILRELKNQIPLHFFAIFSQEKDEVGVGMETCIERTVIPEMEAEMKKCDFGGETMQLYTGGILIGLAGIPNFLDIDGEGRMPPGEGENVGVEVDVNTSRVTPGDFEGDVGMDWFRTCAGGFGTRPYVWLGGIAEVCHARCDGIIILRMNEDVDVTERTGGEILVKTWNK